MVRGTHDCAAEFCHCGVFREGQGGMMGLEVLLHADGSMACQPQGCWNWYGREYVQPS
jgi:hypothetical protein